MLTQLIFWTCNILEAVLLVRAIRGNYFGRYSLFYGYLVCVFVQSLARFYVFSWHAGLYPYFYWGTQLIDALMGCGIIFELYRQGLLHYQGAARMARNVIVFVFAVVISKVLANAISGASWSPATIVFHLERNLRIVQSVLLIVVIGLSYYYAITLGKNLCHDPGLPGGTGQTFPWEWAGDLALRYRLVVSGGLDAVNVGDAIRALQPWGVDASSRLESSPGVKDPARVRAYVRAAREAELVTIG